MPAGQISGTKIIQCSQTTNLIIEINLKALYESFIISCYLCRVNHNFVCIVAMFLRYRRRVDVNKRICSIAYVEIHKIVISLSVWWHGNVCL